MINGCKGAGEGWPTHSSTVLQTLQMTVFSEWDWNMAAFAFLSMMVVWRLHETWMELCALLVTTSHYNLVDLKYFRSERSRSKIYTVYRYIKICGIILFRNCVLVQGNDGDIKYRKSNFFKQSHENVFVLMTWFILRIHNHFEMLIQAFNISPNPITSQLEGGTTEEHWQYFVIVGCLIMASSLHL